MSCFLFHLILWLVWILRKEMMRRIYQWTRENFYLIVKYHTDHGIALNLISYKRTSNCCEFCLSQKLKREDPLTTVIWYKNRENFLTRICNQGNKSKNSNVLKLSYDISSICNWENPSNIFSSKIYCPTIAFHILVILTSQIGLKIHERSK